MRVLRRFIPGVDYELVRRDKKREADVRVLEHTPVAGEAPAGLGKYLYALEKEDDVKEVCRPGGEVDAKGLDDALLEFPDGLLRRRFRCGVGR